VSIRYIGQQGKITVVKVANTALEDVAKFNYLVTTVIYENFIKE
jgi:hypothetical protein